MNGAYVKRCIPVKSEELKWIKVPLPTDTNHFVTLVAGGRIFQEKSEIFQVDSSITSLESGIWDIPMIGGERIDVEYQLQQIVSGIEVTAVSFEGIHITSLTGDLYEIQTRHEDDLCHGNYFYDKNNFHPSGCLPDSAFFVVRTAALRDFEESVNGTTQRPEIPVQTRERNTLLTIIAALCKEAKLDYTKHAKTAGLIQSMAEKMGLSIGESTIEGHLKKITDAVASRMK